MFFLFRMAFWLSVVLVLLPSGGSKQNAAASHTDIGTADAVSAASATVSDMRNFCSRQPEACAVGSQAAIALGERAQAGAKMVYDFISERASERTAPRETGSIANKPVKPAAVAKASQDTLTAADLAPAWRGPRREAHNKPGA
jgi:Family of unknown function (DUF5330)